MKVLVVGGTGFLGGAMTDAARAAGHEVAVLTRGATQRALPEGVEALVADRHASLGVLEGRSFDLVIDTCAYAPEAVEALLDALGSRIGRYALVSSISVYRDFAQPVDEASPVQRATVEQLADARALPVERRSSAASYAAAYGALKRECEIAAEGRLGSRALLIRAGLLVGAGDYTDRLTYWVRRIDEGGTVACPGDPEAGVQFIDVRDVAAFTLEAAAREAGGAFNVTSRPLPMGTFLEACRKAAGSKAELRWVPEERILAAGLAPWSEVPVWLPRSNEGFRHFLDVSVERAFAAGLTTRPVAETVEGILAWDRTRRDTPLKAGLPREKEAALLAPNADAA